MKFLIWECAACGYRFEAETNMSPLIEGRLVRCPQCDGDKFYSVQPDKLPRLTLTPRQRGAWKKPYVTRAWAMCAEWGVSLDVIAREFEASFEQVWYNGGKQ